MKITFKVNFPFHHPSLSSFFPPPFASSITERERERNGKKERKRDRRRRKKKGRKTLITRQFTIHIK